MRRRQVLLCVALATVVAAAPATAAPPPGLEPVTIDAYGIALSVPSGWRARPTPAGTSRTGVVSVFASTSAARRFRPNLNLIVGPLAGGETVREWMLGAQSARYLSIGTLSSVTIHGTRAFRYVTTGLERIGARRLLTVEYAFGRRGRAYLFTYTSLAGRNAPYLRLFTASARTIRFGAGPPAA